MYSRSRASKNRFGQKYARFHNEISMVDSRSFSPKVIKDLKRNCKEFKGAR